ncbi:MAG TPA: hypothetical protein VGM26_11050 [Rhizomicrobium sp.]|jgi:hypothetical protein
MTTALAERRCGDCKACCNELKIKAPQLRKKAHTMCAHHTGAGCGIYESRPLVCRQFLCGWRLFGELDDGWRPDLSGALIMRLAPAQLPPAWHGPGYGVQIAITGGEAAIARPGFAEYVAELLAQGVAVYLSAASPATLVNEHLDAAHDLDALRQVLARLYAMLHAARWQRGIGMLLPLYRLQLERQRFLAQRKLSNIS